MAEKKTLFILETIKKKMSKFDRKSDEAASATTPIGDEFEYITPPKKIDSKQATQEEKKHEDQIAQFEDDLGLDDDHGLASKTAFTPEVKKVEEVKTVAPVTAPPAAQIAKTTSTSTPPAPNVLENKPAAPQISEVTKEKQEEKIDPTEAALNQARAAEAAAAAKAAIMGVPIAVANPEVAVAQVASANADDFTFAEAEYPFATTPTAPVEENETPKFIESSVAPEAPLVSANPVIIADEDSDPFAQNSDFEVEEKAAAELQAQQVQTSTATIDQPQVPSEPEKTETNPEAEAKQAFANEDHEFDFSDLEKDEEESSPSESAQNTKQDVLVPESSEITEQKSEITVDHFILDKPLEEAKEAVNQLLENPSPVEIEMPQTPSPDLDAEFEKEMLSFVPQNSAVNNFQRIPQFDARKQTFSSNETASIISGKAAKQASDSIQKLLDAKRSQETTKSATTQDVAISNELVEAKLAQWIDKNLPGIVDRIVREEIQKLMKN
jgi:cell pole-organizing protein PopZ